MTVHDTHSLPTVYRSDGPPGHRLEEAPTRFWCRVEVLYPDSSLLILLWHHPVPDLYMFGTVWRLQTQAPPGSRIIATHCDGTATEVPVLGPQTRP